MTPSVIADQYAKALLRLSKAKEQFRGDLHKVVDIFEKNPRFSDYFQAPQISRAEKENLFKKCFEGKADPLLLNLLFHLLKKRRMQDLPTIAKAYERRLMEEAEIFIATMVTAVPADATIKEKVLKKLEKTFQQKISIKERVDPSIIGGIMIMTDNQMMDASVKNRLTFLKEELLNLSI
jgi:F-type H+-transporting ATPase subunit delta